MLHMQSLLSVTTAPLQSDIVLTVCLMLHMHLQLLPRMPRRLPEGVVRNAAHAVTAVSYYSPSAQSQWTIALLHSDNGLQPLSTVTMF